MTAKTPEERIVDLGLALPPPARAVANYVPWAITGNLVMTSGNLPWRDGKLACVGKIGREISGDDGYRSCQLSCLNALAQIKEAVGELAKVKRIVRLEGVLGVDDAYKEHPKCLDGASDLINTAFEEKGRHTRMIYTNPVMPLDCKHWPVDGPVVGSNKLYVLLVVPALIVTVLVFDELLKTRLPVI